jgi:hypothetical protein
MRPALDGLGAGVRLDRGSIIISGFVPKVRGLVPSQREKVSGADASGHRVRNRDGAA